MYILYELNDFCLKQKLQEEMWSPTTIENHLWKYHYVLTEMLDRYYMKSYTSKRVPFYFKPHSDLLKSSKLFGVKTRLLTKIVHDLERWGLILVVRHFNSFTTKNGFKVDGFSTHCEFKFFDERVAAGWKVWNDPTVKPGPTNHLPNTPFLPEKKPLTGIYKQLADHLPLVQIDTVAAKKFAADALRDQMPLKDKVRKFRPVTGRYVTKEVHDTWVSMIDAIAAGDFSPTQDEDKTGRFFNRLSSFPGVLRHTFSINGKPLVEVDVSNCQCLIFCIYLKELYADDELPLPRDVVKFIDECERGVFYATAQRLIDPEYTVEPIDFKIKFFARIFFSSGTRKYEWIKSFQHSYPNVYKHIADFKTSKGYKALPVHMQSMEADIMLHQICKQLYRNGIHEFYTIHDAIYCTADDKAAVEQIVYTEFQKYGVTPHVKSKQK